MKNISNLSRINIQLSLNNGHSYVETNNNLIYSYESDEPLLYTYMDDDDDKNDLNDSDNNDDINIKKKKKKKKKRKTNKFY